MSLTLRTTKGNPLSNQELDNNFLYLDGRISVLDNTVGNAVNTVIPTLQGDIDDLSSGKQAANAKLTSLSATTTSGLLALNGDTVTPRVLTAGSSSIVITNPTGASGNPTIDVGSNVITTDGIQALSNKTISGVSNTFTGIPLSAVTGILPILKGGHGGTTAEEARTNLDVLKKPISTGIVVKTDDDVTLVRSITTSGVGLGVTNGSGVSGNIDISLNATPASIPNSVVARDSNGNFSANTITATLNGFATSAGSVTNGVVTTGSYSNPPWITSLSGSKVNGIPNSSLQNSTFVINGQQVSLGGSVTLALSGGTSSNVPDVLVLRDSSGNFAANVITATLNGSASSAASAGTAVTATRLVTPRNINGVAFDGSADITVADNTKLPLTGGAISVAGQLQVKQVEYVFDAGNTGASFTPDWANGTIQTVIANNNFTLNTPLNMPNGGSLTLIITMNTSGRVMTSTSAAYRFAGGYRSISTVSGAIDMINIFRAGSIYYATLSNGYQ